MTQFSTTNQPANPGRRKNMFTALKDKYSLSSDDVNTIIEYLCSLTPKQLNDEILTNENKTVLEVAFARAILEAIKKGDLTQIEKLLDRKIGKVANKVDAKVESELNINITMPKNDNN